MLKRLNRVLNIVMGSCVGVAIGHGAYVCWHYKTHPDLYRAWSAPWYTSIFVYGAFAAAVLLLCTIIKSALKFYNRT